LHECTREFNGRKLPGELAGRSFCRFCAAESDDIFRGVGRMTVAIFDPHIDGSAGKTSAANDAPGRYAKKVKFTWERMVVSLECFGWLRRIRSPFIRSELPDIASHVVE